MSRIDEAIQAKKEKRQGLEALGVVAHPYSFDKQHAISQAREMMDQSVQTAGRIVSLRTHGKVIFLDLQDSTASIQVMIREQEVGLEQFNLFKHIDAGDFLGVSGTIMTSKTGEITILVLSFTFLGKALRPIPTAWNTAEDKEVRFRKRYLDMLINPATKKVLDARWLIEKEIRRYLQDQHEFIEVETPVFQPLYGGTNAKPFSTHMNALDVDYYLRLAPELYLKRLIVGGYEKIFEIARNFRNEGIDQTHQPEFTMIEWYEAYADYNKVMDVAEGLFKHVAQQLYGHTRIAVDSHEIDLGGKWPRLSMKDALKQYVQIDFDSQTDDQLKALLSERKIDLIGEFTRGKAQFALFDKLIPEFLIDPVWIINYPRDISPLAKAHRLDSSLAERFEAYVGGREIADGWSEITDALDQRNIFENEQTRMRAGDTEAHPLDEDFLEAMEYGMPPLGGIGIGVDRLVMFLTNTWSIREVIAFPTLRPLNQPKHKKADKPVLQLSTESSSFTISPAIKEQYPSVSVGVAIIKGVLVQKSSPELDQAKRAMVVQLSGLTTEAFAEFPEVKSYRQLYKAMGVDWHSRRPSPEALLRRITQGKALYTINTAVDAANLAVLEHKISVGVFNLSALQLPAKLDIAQGGEQILLLGDEAPTALKAGEVAYFDQAGAYNLDYNYRDSQRTMVTETTHDILINVDGIFDITEEQVAETLATVITNIQKYCGGTVTETSIISAQSKE